MKKSFLSRSIAMICMLAVIISFTGCSVASPNPDEEAVWVEKPWFVGHGGIDNEPVSTGLSYGCLSSKAVYFKVVPTRYDEKFDDIFSNDNTPLDFNTYLNIQIEKGKTHILLANYGEDWYKNNIQVEYRNRTRIYVSLYSPFDLMSNRDIIQSIDSALLVDMNNYIQQLSQEKEFPVIVRSITTGAARPNKGQMDEMNRTATAIQAAKTQEYLANVEEIRILTEKLKGIADRTYKEVMGMTNDQFLQLKNIEMISEKANANVDVLVGSGYAPVWNIKK